MVGGDGLPVALWLWDVTCNEIIDESRRKYCFARYSVIIELKRWIVVPQ